MFSCTKCGLYFSEAKKLEEHRSTHPLKYQCSSCLSEYDSQSALLEHQHSDWDCNRRYIPMPEGRVQCKSCLEIFDTRFKLNKHFKLRHQKERLTCKICERVFATPRTLSKHLFVHSKVPRFECEECHKKFKSPTGLKNHTLLQHGRTKVVDSAGNETYVAIPKQQETCNICSKKFATKDTLRTHMRIVHTEDAKFCCENCGQKFKYKKTFKHHMLSHKVGIEESYECPLCKNKFKLQKGVLSHIRKIHSDVLKSNETLKELTLNGKDLRNPSNKQKFFDILIEIGATYQAPTSFRCDICSSIHATRKSLVSHKYRVHSQGGYAEYHCDYCGKTFPNRSTLITDIEQHIKPYECKTCGARLGSSSTLKTHETKHEQFYRFTCDFCQRKFSSRALLYQHMKFIELRLTRI
jgi:KRAB domain-containing zinc finger protein